MESALFHALVIAVGGIPVPGSILLVLILLGTNGGLKSAFAYASGYTTGYFLIGAATLIIGSQVARSPSAENETSLYSWLYAGIGILFYIIGIIRLIRPSKSEGPPKIFQKIDNLSPGKSLITGLVVSGINFKNLAILLSSVSVIIEIEPTFLTGSYSLGLIVLVFCFGVYFPVLIFMFFREQSITLLGRARRYLEKHSFIISQTALFIFGTYFIIRGLAGLL